MKINILHFEVATLNDCVRLPNVLKWNIEEVTFFKCFVIYEDKHSSF